MVNKLQTAVSWEITTVKFCAFLLIPAHFLLQLRLVQSGCSGISLQ